MNNIDFTQPGGFPLTQDQLGFLQDAYTNACQALASMGSDGTDPIIITGMVQTTSGGGGIAISDGWFFANNQLVQFSGSAPAPLSLYVPMIQIETTSTTLTYNDGSTPSVINTVSGSVYYGDPATADSTHLLWSAFNSFQQQFGINGRDSTWTLLSVATGSGVGNVTGNIYYKKNTLNNQVYIRGQLTANQAQNFAPSPTSLFYIMNGLPTGYIPANNQYFETHYYAGNEFLDDTGVEYAKHFTSLVDTAGKIQINFQRPNIAITAYSVVFSAIITLD